MWSIERRRCGLLSELQTQRHQGILCDFVFIVNKEKRYSVHRSVLAANSDIFRQAFCTVIGKGLSEYHVNVNSIELFEQLLCYLYCEEYKSQQPLNLDELMLLSRELGISEVMLWCQSLVTNSYNVDNLLDLYLFIKCFNLEQCCYEKIANYLALHLEEFAMQDILAQLDVEFLCRVFNAGTAVSAVRKTEAKFRKQCLQVVDKWMTNDNWQRKPVMEKLLQSLSITGYNTDHTLCTVDKFTTSKPDPLSCTLSENSQSYVNKSCDNLKDKVTNRTVDSCSLHIENLANKSLTLTCISSTADSSIMGVKSLNGVRQCTDDKVLTPATENEPNCFVDVKKHSSPESRTLKVSSSSRKHKKGSVTKISDAENFNCDKCEKTFKLKSVLLRHLESHGSDVPYLCSVCGFSTIHRSSMIVHNKQHTGAKYRCSYPSCTFSTVRRLCLSDHMNKHTGERNYTCSTCGKSFTCHRHLKSHELLHCKDRLLLCRRCSYRTLHQDRLLRHVKARHQHDQ